MDRGVIERQKAEILSQRAKRYVSRRVQIPSLDSTLIKVVMGPRRAGKSFLCARTVLDAGAFGYVNFDDGALAGDTVHEKLLDV